MQNMTMCKYINIKIIHFGGKTSIYGIKHCNKLVLFILMYEIFRPWGRYIEHIY